MAHWSSYVRTNISRGIEAEILPVARELGVSITGDNLAKNLALVEALRQIAEAKGATVAQLAIAWVLAQGDDIVPMVGARRRDRLARIEAAVPAGAIAGDRYDARGMAILDSERRREVLRRFGPQKANLVDVARALEVSHGTIYRHFASKAALRDAVAQRWGQVARIVRDGMASGELRTGDPAVVARAVFQATALFHHPVHATEWSDPDIDAAFEGVWRLILNGLAGKRGD